MIGQVELDVVNPDWSGNPSRRLTDPLPVPRRPRDPGADELQQTVVVEAVRRRFENHDRPHVHRGGRFLKVQEGSVKRTQPVQHVLILTQPEGRNRVARITPDGGCARGRCAAAGRPGRVDHEASELGYGLPGRRMRGVFGQRPSSQHGAIEGGPIIRDEVGLLDVRESCQCLGEPGLGPEPTALARTFVTTTCLVEASWRSRSSRSERTSRCIPIGSALPTTNTRSALSTAVTVAPLRRGAWVS